MVDPNTDGVYEKDRIRIHSTDDDIGLCLSCGHRLTLCGAAFSAALRCDKCKRINIYKESKQPVALAE